MIYLASSYSHPTTAVREQRYRETCSQTARILRAGLTVFSPVVRSRPLIDHGLPTDWHYRERINYAFLQLCDELVVLMLDGRRKSAGVSAEIRGARELGKRVHYLDPQDAAGSPTFATLATEVAP